MSASPQWRRLACVLLLGALPLAAQAQRVLVLTTSETRSDAVTIQQNCIGEFQNSSATTVDVRAGALNSATTLTAADFNPPEGPYDVVVTCTVYNGATAGNIGAIDNAVKTRAAQAFFLFDEQLSFFPTLSGAKAGWTLVSAGNGGASTQVTLNTASIYSGSFVGLDPYGAHSFATFSGVPVNNALYLPPGVAVPTLPITPGQTLRASTIIVPTRESYLDATDTPRGACLFFNTDVSGFDQVRYPALRNRIASAFLAAASPGGACGVPASLTKGFAPASIIPGGVAMLTLQVANAGTTAVAGLNVTDHLPAPLVVAGAASTSCSAGALTAVAGSGTVALTGATLPVGGCAITVPVRWPVASASLCVAPGTTLTNTILPGTDFTTNEGQASTPATATLSCLGSPSLPAAVPTLGQWALALLTLLLLVGGIWVLRPVARRP